MIGDRITPVIGKSEMDPSIRTMAFLPLALAAGYYIYEQYLSLSLIIINDYVGHRTINMLAVIGGECRFHRKMIFVAIYTPHRYI